MKKSEPRSLTICRLLTLLFIVLVGVGSAANQVNGASLGVHPLKDARVDLYNYFFNQTVKDTVEETGTQIRKHLLYNVCSDRIVKIIRKGRKGINARGKKNGRNMNFSKLIIESKPRSGTIKIFGEKTGLHMCFSKRGKLRAQVNGKSIRCQFKEEYSEDKQYTRFKTADTTKNWYLGFKKNGKPRKGTDINLINEKHKDCFKFEKRRLQSRTSNSNKPVCPSGKGNGPKGVDFCDNKILNLFQNMNRVRHDNKHHKRRGKG